ncbi:hypothetical protein [Actinophytocola sediminis]
MGHRTRGLLAPALVALTVLTSCSDSGSSSGDSADERTISSADEVIKIVDQGFVTFSSRPGVVPTEYVSWGFVIENVTDQVALTIRVEADFLDEAGEVIEEDGEDFTAVLPGQQMGVGGRNSYEGSAIKDMRVKVTLIGSLDTPEGKRLKPPGPYAELTTNSPVASDTGKEIETITLDVTNTYHVPLTPTASAVIRDADGVVVGGMSSKAIKPEIEPGASGRASLARDIQFPRLANGTAEYYADPQLGWPISSNPLWQDLG